MTTLRSIQARVRCRVFAEHQPGCCTEPNSGWWIVWAADPSVLDTYTQPEPMAKHAAPRKTLPERLKAWWNRIYRSLV